MTPEEDIIYDHLDAAHNAFLQLTDGHPKDLEDFSSGIRQLQNLILARIGCRKLGWEYTNEGARIERATE